jgi:hypothetical protein
MPRDRVATTSSKSDATTFGLGAERYLGLTTDVVAARR